MNNDLLDKLSSIEKEISSKKGKFTFFAVILRKDAPNKWDLVLSAGWFKKNQKETMDYLTKIIQKNLDPVELLELSRMVLLREGTPFLEAMHKTFRVTDSDNRTRLVNVNLYGLEIEEAYIFISMKSDNIKNK